jgi:dTMP kinase
MARGKFIVFEGGEGSGKSAVISRLRPMLPDAVFARHPGGTPAGEKIRSFVLGKEAEGIDTGAEILLFLADRAELVAKVIAPSLAAGHTVICDRFELSTLVYQVYGRERPEYAELLSMASKTTNKGYVPDATIFLDVSPEIGLARARSRAEGPDRIEAQPLAFHERIRDGYKKHIHDYANAFVIDANRPLEEVWTDVQNAVQSSL